MPRTGSALSVRSARRRITPRNRSHPAPAYTCARMPPAGIQDNPFTASRAVTLLEHFRVPYVIDANGRSDSIESLRSDAGGELLWPSDTSRFPAVAVTM